MTTMKTMTATKMKTKTRARARARARAEAVMATRHRDLIRIRPRMLQEGGNCMEEDGGTMTITMLWTKMT